MSGKILLAFKVFLYLCFTLKIISSSTTQSIETYSRAYTDKCTAIVVGRLATKDGSTMTTHTADCAECDWRINKVPSQTYHSGALRPIYLITGAYPRQVRDDRGKTWSPDNLENIPVLRPQWERMRGDIIGYIPQVEHTFALIEGMYGIMNEHQVAIGESTCAAKLWAAPKGDIGKGRALLEASELSQIALERSRTAREAIRTMGELAVQYGFYSADWSITPLFGENLPKGEGGEALTVIDPEEAWMFHIIPDDTGSSAIWVAQRVPDSHISVVSNGFVIGDVDPNSPDFLYSPNLWSVARRLGWWSPSESPLLNFKKTYAPERYHPNYVNQRAWRVLSVFAPSLNISTESDSMTNLPFSVPVDEDLKIAPTDLMRIQRDHFEGTPFSATEGLAGGPYGDPNRFDLSVTGELTLDEVLQGEFPRTISLFRTSYSFVAQSRRFVPNILSLLWFCQYAPDSSSYSPIYVAASELPTPFTRGTMHEYSTESAWWNACVVGNYAARFYKFAMSPVRKLQKRLEASLSAEVLAMEASIRTAISGSIGSAKELTNQLTQFTLEKGQQVSNEWRDLFPYILTHYRDGYVLDTDSPTIGIAKMFYPRWWLEAVGYFKIGPNLSPNAIMFASKDQVLSAGSFQVSLFFYIFSLVVVSLLSAVIMRYSIRKNEEKGYQRILEI